MSKLYPPSPISNAGTGKRWRSVWDRWDNETPYQPTYEVESFMDRLKSLFKKTDEKEKPQDV